MASFQNYGVDRGSAAQQVVQTHTVHGDVYEGNQLIASFQGANAANIPGDFVLLPQEIQDQYAAEIGPLILKAKAGVL